MLASLLSSTPSLGSEGSPKDSCVLQVLLHDDFGIADSTSFKEGGLVGDALAALYRKEDPKAASKFALDTIGSEAKKKMIIDHLDENKIGLPGYKISFSNIDQNIAEYYSNRKSQPRKFELHNNCYAELLFVNNYIRTSLYRKLSFLYVLRVFGDGEKPVKVEASAPWFDAKAFPPRSEADVAPARDELVTALSQSLTVFQAEMAKKLPKSH